MTNKPTEKLTRRVGSGSSAKPTLDTKTIERTSSLVRSVVLFLPHNNSFLTTKLSLFLPPLFPSTSFVRPNTDRPHFSPVSLPSCSLLPPLRLHLSAIRSLPLPQILPMVPRALLPRLRPRPEAQAGQGQVSSRSGREIR